MQWIKSGIENLLLLHKYIDQLTLDTVHIKCSSF